MEVKSTHYIYHGRGRKEPSTTNPTYEGEIMSDVLLEKLDTMIDELLNPDSVKVLDLESMFTVGIYFLVSENEIVYVGQSIDIGQRVRSHRNDIKKVFDEVRFIECKEEELLEKECEFISVLNPKYNKTKTDGFYGCCPDIVKSIFTRNKKENTWILKNIKYNSFFS